MTWNTFFKNINEESLNRNAMMSCIVFVLHLWSSFYYYYVCVPVLICPWGVLLFKQCIFKKYHFSLKIQTNPLLNIYLQLCRHIFLEMHFLLYWTTTAEFLAHFRDKKKDILRYFSTWTFCKHALIVGFDLIMSERFII